MMIKICVGVVVVVVWMNMKEGLEVWVFGCLVVVVRLFGLGLKVWRSG